MGKLAGDHVQVLVGGYELTGDSNKLMFDDSYATFDQTTFGDEVVNYILGQRTMKVQHSGFMNVAAGRSHPVLKGIDVNGAISVLVGQNATPVVGDPMYSLLTQQEKYQALPENGKVIAFNANFPNRGALGGWGVALAVPTTFTNTSNGSAVNNGAASINGGAGFVHVLQNADNATYDIEIEGSATGAFGGEETSLGTFTTTQSELTSGRIGITSSIHEHVRWKATLASGVSGQTIEIAVSLIRF